MTVRPAVGVKPPGYQCVAGAGVTKGTERVPPLMNVGLGGEVLQSGSQRVICRVMAEVPGVSGRLVGFARAVGRVGVGGSVLPRSP